MRTVVLFLALFAAGCQNETDGVRTLCNAPRDCAECQNIDPAQRDRVMAEHIERSVRHDGARTLFEKLATVNDAERAKLLRAAAEAVGLSSCLLADRYAARAEAWQARQEDKLEAPPPE